MTAYWGSNTATQEILIIRAPPAFFPSVVARQQERPTLDIHVCVVFLVGRRGGADQGVYRRTLGLFY